MGSTMFNPSMVVPMSFQDTMPMTSPRSLTSGPPLLPGLNGVSVWIHVIGLGSSVENLVPARKGFADTIPEVMTTVGPAA